MSKPKSKSSETALAESTATPASTPTPTFPTVLDLPRLRWTDLLRFPESLLDEHAIKVEEFDEDGTHVVRAEMPGIDPDHDVDVSVDHGVLVMTAERRHQERTEDNGRYRSEFRYGAFSRSVHLPPGAGEDDVKATYTDGILEIRFPTDGERARARKIPVGRG